MQLKTAAQSQYSRYSIWLYACVIGLGLYIGWLDFIPSAAWLDLSFYAAMILSVVIGVAAAVYLKRQQKTYRKEIPSWLLRQCFYLLMIFLLFIILWGGLGHGLGALLHQAVAKTTQMEMVVDKQHHQNQKRCRYQLRATTIQSTFPAYVCISKTGYSAFPQQATPVRFSGKQSVFGFTVSEWKIRSESSKG